MCARVCEKERGGGGRGQREGGGGGAESACVYTRRRKRRRKWGRFEQSNPQLTVLGGSVCMTVSVVKTHRRSSARWHFPPPQQTALKASISY